MSISILRGVIVNIAWNDRYVDRFACVVWLQVIDFHGFEEMFKLDSVTLADMDIDGTLPGSKAMTMKRPEAMTLLEPNRMRNVGQ